MKTLLINCQTPTGIKNILIKDDLITYLGPEKPDHDEIIDCSDLLVMPGLIDAHVHVRDLEMANKETWETASKSAIIGGITTIMDMPNTKPATIDLTGLDAKRKAAEKSLVNYRLHLGATETNLQQLSSILKEYPADVVGIKVFLAGSSSNEVVDNPQKLTEIFMLAKEFDKVVLVHSEMQKILDKWQKRFPEQTIEQHNNIRNREAAYAGTKLILELAGKIGNKLYICHVSTAEEIDLIRSAKRENDKIFCEVTPHHLFLDETILLRAGNFGKVNPPLRTQNDNSVLLTALTDGTIDCIGTDHAPHTMEEKKQAYQKAPSGFPGLETAFAALFTNIRKQFSDQKTLEIISKLYSQNPALIFGIEKRGELKVGNYADIFVMDPKKEWTINAKNFRTKAKYSPFDGMKVDGKIVMCLVEGKCPDVILSDPAAAGLYRRIGTKGLV